MDAAILIFSAIFFFSFRVCVCVCVCGGGGGGGTVALVPTLVPTLDISDMLLSISVHISKHISISVISISFLAIRGSFHLHLPVTRVFCLGGCCLCVLVCSCCVCVFMLHVCVRSHSSLRLLVFMLRVCMCSCYMGWWVGGWVGWKCLFLKLSLRTNF